MIRRILAAAVRWAIKPELDAVRQEVHELKGTFGKQLVNIGLQLENDDVPVEAITVLYYVAYHYTHNPTGYSNGALVGGCGSIPIKVDTGGIRAFETVQKIIQHIAHRLSVEEKLNNPVVYISNYIELQRWLTEPKNGKEASNI